MAGGITIAIRLTPKGARERIDGIVTLPDGGAALKVAVTAPPEDGRANAALLRFLAREWRLPRSAFGLVWGAADRRKIVRVAGDSGVLMASFAAWRDGHDG
ncbi:MAG: DUF167 domain-containing protein [Rhodospirillaceae bacterium]|nr:DUF167 domain-containing protein [Rhodospirillaceae bacterium]